MVAWLVDCLVTWFALVGWLVGLVGWLARRVISWLLARLLDRSVARVARLQVHDRPRAAARRPIDARTSGGRRLALARGATPHQPRRRREWRRLPVAAARRWRMPRQRDAPPRR
eukprot:3590627-Prymnesium_polylepis.1